MAQIIENAKLDVLAQIAENKGENITKEQLVVVLNNYFETVSTSSIPNNISSTNDVVLTTIDEKYTINLSEIYSGNFTTKEESIAYVIGDYITINGEGFYVIEDSPINQTTVKLITSKFVNTLTKKQDDNANTVIFDNSTNVYANSSIKTKVESYVSSLGVSVVSSGLISCDDLESLEGEMDLVVLNNNLGTPSFWLDSLGCDEGYAWQGNLGRDYAEANMDWGGITETYYYLRPFIEILKSNI